MIVYDEKIYLDIQSKVIVLMAVENLLYTNNYTIIIWVRTLFLFLLII